MFTGIGGLTSEETGGQIDGEEVAHFLEMLAEPPVMNTVGNRFKKPIQRVEGR